jgi:hypothetical protein
VKKISIIIINVVILLCSGISQANTWQPPHGLKQIPIWPDGKMPDPVSDKTPENIKMITDRPIAGKPWHGVYNALNLR